MTQATVPAVAAARPTTLSRRTMTIIASAVGLVVLIVVYKVTRGQQVPSWLNVHVQQHAQDAYHWITQNTGRNWLLDAVKSIGTGINWLLGRFGK